MQKRVPQGHDATMTDWAGIESKWHKRWSGTEYAKVESSRKKKFITVAYPYPNSPQHVGHGRTYTLADVHARFERMHGINVLFPMAFHYTGTPILGMAQRIASGDEKLIKDINEIYGVPRSDIETFSDPVKIAGYFHKEIKSGMIEMGYSIDWSGEFTTIDTAYQKFIAWQVNLMRERGVIVQGSHPVGWCTRDKNPVSQHDTLGDVEPDFVEYVIVRAALDDGRILPAATMRPETVHGVTNMWVNPDMEYITVKVGEKKWLVSTEAVEKLEHLGCEASRLDERPVKGSELVGQSVQIPGIERKVPVLPAGFVRGQTGTGAVMSVPAHAPYDYQALEDLKGGLGETASIASSITLLSIMSAGQLGGTPKLVAESGIKDQNDERLEELTKKIYADEFSNSVMLENTGRLAGMRASDAKVDAAKWLTEIQGEAPAIMYEFSNAPIHCRCGTQCVVHILKNQWFLNYADESWKESARQCLKDVQIVPPDMRAEFDYVFGWLRERACARQKGLGTKLPWDAGWIVESLSDSVIYMAYYIISRFVNENKINPESLNGAFFDYVFFGSGDESGVSSSCDMPKEILAEIRAAFVYFYPVDSRHSGRDLVPNHLSFFVFNHALIFPKEHWPGQIVVNGSVMMGGKKMSKSMANTVPLRQAVRKYGADPIRLSILMSAELLQDAEFKLDTVNTTSGRLESMMRECMRVGALEGEKEKSSADMWLEARMREVSAQVEGLVRQMRMREALGKVFSELDSAFAWYEQRCTQDANPAALRTVWSARVALLSPFAPHAADEMWEALGNKGTASGSMWPFGPQQGDSDLLCAESLLEQVLEDIQRILELLKLDPSRIILYVANSEKQTAYKQMLKASQTGKSDIGTMMHVLGESEQTRQMCKDAKYVKRTLADILSTTSRNRTMRLESDGLDEVALYGTTLAELVKTRFGVDLTVYAESDPNIEDPKNKARMARPFKPAILIE